MSNRIEITNSVLTVEIEQFSTGNGGVDVTITDPYGATESVCLLPSDFRRIIRSENARLDAFLAR